MYVYIAKVLFTLTWFSSRNLKTLLRFHRRQLFNYWFQLKQCYGTMYTVTSHGSCYKTTQFQWS